MHRYSNSDCIRKQCNFVLPLSFIVQELLRYMKSYKRVKYNS